MENKTLFFDTGPLITLIMSRLEWILPHLKKKFGGKFYVTPAVYRELIERPLETKRFKFEALQALKLFREEVLQIYPKVQRQRVVELQSLANSSFSIHGNALDLLQSGELESVTAAVEIKAAAVVIDERTLRLSIENPSGVEHLLKHRFEGPIVSFPERIKAFSEKLQEVKIIRSIELISLAYKLKLLESYLPEQEQAREFLLDAVLWAAKTNGAAVTEEEIEEVKKYLLKK